MNIMLSMNFTLVTILSALILPPKMRHYFKNNHTHTHFFIIKAITRSEGDSKIVIEEKGQ